MKDYNSMKHTLLVFNSKETLVDTIIEQDKEKERLKKDNEYLNKVNIELSTEKNRLNNIINELERKLLSTYSTYVSMDKVPEIAKYIRELKGSNENG